MHLQSIQNINDLEKIGTEWNQLLTSCSASYVPFLRHEFLCAWWKNLGGGEWQEANLYTILGRSDSQDPLGIAPLFFTKNLEDLPALMLLGSIEIADYLDFIAKPKDIPPFVDSVLDLLSSEEAPNWQVLDLYNIPEESPTIPALQRAAEKRDWLFTLKKLQPCPYIPLPGDWEEYLAGIDKKQRHEIRRKLRRAENYELPVSWFISEQEETLANDIEAFFSLMAQDTEKEAFLTESMRSHLQETIQAAFKAGWLQLAFLEIGGEKAAGYLNFDFNDHIWVYNSGLNYQYGNLSPGWVLLSELIKWAIENKRSSVDFMRGDENYKYKFGGIDRFVMRVSISRKS